MKPFYTKVWLAVLVSCTLSLTAAAQYCSPTINSSGIYILQINLLDYGNIQGGLKYFTGSTGYTQTLSPSSGIVKRYFGGGFFYSISNPTGGTLPYDFRGYADWNNDGDFTDPGEDCFAVSGTVPPISSTTTGNNIVPPLSLPAGNYRVRFALSQTGVATPCGSYTGEVEDYIITIPNNIAPVLNTSATTAPNTLLSSETNSNGISVAEFIKSSQPNSELITEGDDLYTTNWYGLAPQGIAIIGQSATNGTWQYKVGAGAWTNFGSVSSSNALLLMADAAYSNYQPGSRIRFVPTGTGTPTFTYRAYDGTWSSNGSYANIAATGLTTAFSTASKTASLPVIVNSGFTDNMIISTLNNNIYTAPFNKVAGTTANPELLLSNSPDYYAADMSMDAGTNKLFWVAGSNGDKIASSDINGSALNTSLVTGLTYITGLATGNNKLFYWNWESDYSAANLYQSNLDGTGAVKISGGAGKFDGTGMYDTKDIEYYNNKIYFQYTSPLFSFIASANTDGTGFTNLYSTVNNFTGLAVSSDNNIYWTESNGSLNKMSITGGLVTNLVLEPTRSLGDMMVDGATGQVYFIDNDLLNPNYSLIRKVSTSGGSISTLLTTTGTATAFAFNPSLTVLAANSTLLAGQYNAQQHMAALQWTTTAEDNLQQFILERSIDGTNFTAVATITAIGTAAGQTYPYNDDVKNINTDKLYYRLKLITKDARSSYTPVVLLRINTNPISKVSPNPGNGLYTIQLSAVPTAAVTIKVYNSNGAIINTGSFKTQTYQLDLSAKANGLYYAQLIYADGTKTEIRLVKQ